jgi:hypothetical protein
MYFTVYGHMYITCILHYKTLCIPIYGVEVVVTGVSKAPPLTGQWPSPHMERELGVTVSPMVAIASSYGTPQGLTFRRGLTTLRFGSHGGSLDLKVCNP